MTEKRKEYGFSDRAWQPIVGCDPHMKCAPRCWARKTVARVVECQKGKHPERAEFFQIALTPDGKQWSGKTYLDPSHLNDPMHWKKPALIATGFHGDIGRAAVADQLDVFQVIGKCPQHDFMLLTKQPDGLMDLVAHRRWRNLGRNGTWPDHWVAVIPGHHREGDSRFLPNVTIGCSIMDQHDADAQFQHMSRLNDLGWATHVWYEPAIGPVNWRGWEFLRGMIVGFESGSKSRPGHPQWARDTRDWCVQHGIPFNFKQWGDFVSVSEVSGKGPHHRFSDGATVRRVGKKSAGRLLDGQEWNEIPQMRRAG